MKIFSKLALLIAFNLTAVSLSQTVCLAANTNANQPLPAKEPSFPEADLIPKDAEREALQEFRANTTTKVESPSEKSQAATMTGAAVGDTSSQALMGRDLKNQKESEIPVKLEQPQKSNSSDQPWFRVIFAIAALGVLATAAFLGLRKFNKRTNQQNKATQIKVLTQYALGPKRSLLIIRVAGETLLLGMTDSNINHIKTLSLIDDEIPDIQPSTFKKVFGESTQQSLSAIESNDDEEDFAISEIKEVISNKIKKLRPIQ